MLWLILALIAAALVVVGAFYKVPAFNEWFHDSETLLLARGQMLVGAVWTALEKADIGGIFGALGWAKWVPVALLVMGVITELARRARDPAVK